MTLSWKRLKPIRLTLTAFIISSIEKRTMNMLRRVSTPAAPMTKRNADKTRYHSMGISTLYLLFHEFGSSFFVGVRPGPGLHVLPAVSYTHLRAHETRHDLVC